MKRFVIILLFLTATYQAKCQWVQSAKDELNSFNWDIIGMVNFKKVNDTTVFPIYSEAVKRFANRHFRLTGYMIPMKAGMKQAKFMISTLPINQCYFCGKNGNPIMVIVNAHSPVTFTFKTVTVEGILKLDDENAFYLPPVYLNDAVLAE